MVKQKKVALVLSGGSARGLAHIGVIEELEAQNYEITSIAGTSMGALIGAMYLAGTLGDFKDWILSLKKKDYVRLIDPTFRSGFIKGKKIFAQLHKFIPDCDIADFKKPLAIIATDITNKKEVVFRKGSLREALRATIAVPTIFTPVKKDGAILVDGGATNNIPANRVHRTKGDILVVVDVNTEKPVPKRFVQSHHLVLKQKHSSSKLAILGDVLNYMIHNTSKDALEKTAIDVPIFLSEHISSLYDFLKAPLLIDYGIYETKKSLRTFTTNKK